MAPAAYRVRKEGCSINNQGTVLDFHIALFITVFQKQIDAKGFAMVEVLSNCPQQWHMTPIETLKFIDDEITKTFPLGVFVDRG